MARNPDPDADRPGAADDGDLPVEIDFDIMEIEKDAVERMDRLVNGLFRDEQDAAVQEGQRVARPLRRSRTRSTISPGKFSAGSMSIPRPVKSCVRATAATATHES
jgi:hypothetical protein